MNEFFMNYPLCGSAYLLSVVLFMSAIVWKKAGKYLVSIGLILYVADISFLLVAGFSLYKCAITTGLLLALALAAVKEEKPYEL